MGRRAPSLMELLAPVPHPLLCNQGEGGSRLGLRPHHRHLLLKSRDLHPSAFTLIRGLHP